MTTTWLSGKKGGGGGRRGGLQIKINKTKPVIDHFSLLSSLHFLDHIFYLYFSLAPSLLKMQMIGQTSFLVMTHVHLTLVECGTCGMNMKEF